MPKPRRRVPLQDPERDRPVRYSGKGRVPRRLLIVLIPPILAALVPLGMLARGWFAYRSLERSIIEKMDQYYLTLSQPGREEYLLEDDEVFEVPYMASRLVLEAEPTRIYDRHGGLIGEFLSEKGVYVHHPDVLPAFLKKALVAAEDGTFYEHGGINYRAIIRAQLHNIMRGSIRQGGSTLTQQLAKLMFTTRKKTYGRKIFEAFCARKLESKFTKDQILLMYLNFAYFGHGCFGVESAAQFYFGKAAADLELAEAALLVGIIPNPGRYSPFRRPDLAAAKHRTVLSRMVGLGFVPEATAKRVSEDFWKDMAARLKRPEASFWRMKVNNAPYLVEHVRRELEKDFSKERILKGGLRVRTTFDLALQQAARMALTTGLEKEDELAAKEEEEKAKKTAKAAPQEEDPSEEKHERVLVAGSLLALDPADGGILAMVGGRGFAFHNQLNRAADIRRPIGSSVKPFIFAQAFESGRQTPDDVFDDKPLSFKLAGGRWWRPANYGNKYYGEVDLTTALRKSLNSVAIQLLQKTDIDDVIALLSRATGAPAKRIPRNLSLALGTADLSPVELTAAYAALANGGTTVEPHFLLAIEDRNGEPVKEIMPPAEPRRILKAETCATVRDILKGVFLSGGTAYWSARLEGFSMPAFGKTGTTNDYRDAWFAGATPDVAASVWVGYDDMRRPLGYGRTGGGVAAPIWMSFLKGAYRHRPTREFGEDIGRTESGR